MNKHFALTHTTAGPFAMALVCLLALTLACDNPAAPLLCDDPPPVNAVFGHPVERRVCIAAGDADALSYTAVSSDPERVAVANADRNLTITAMQEEGSADITVTVADGSTIVGTIVYSVVIVPPWSGRITVCNAVYDSDEDATYLTVEGQVKAHLDFTNAAAFVYYGGGPVGWAYIGDMAANQTARIYSSPRGEGDQTGGTCDIDMEYEIADN